MNSKWNRLLLVGCILSVALCVLAWNTELILALHVITAPFFFLQLLLCRVTCRWWLRFIPEMPIVLLMLVAGFYLLRDSGWDRLAALVFGLVAIGPSVGCLLGWAVWGIPILRRRRKEKRQG